MADIPKAKDAADCRVLQVGELPNWINPRESKVIVGVVESLMKAADIKGDIRLSFQRDQSFRKRQIPARSIVPVFSSKFCNAHTLELACVGDDQRNSRVGALVSMARESRQKLCQFLQDRGEGASHPWSSTDTVRAFDQILSVQPHTRAPWTAPAQPETEFVADEESMALYLDALRSAGSVFTKETALALARQLFGSKDQLWLQAATKDEWLIPDGVVMLITDRGFGLLDRMIDSEATPPAPKVSDAPPDFYELQRRVITAREGVSQATDRMKEGEVIDAELLNLREEERVALARRKTAAARLREERAQHHVARNAVLQTERRRRASMDVLQQQFDEARQVLAEAEQEYEQLIALPKAC